jgi:arginyl-tRNA synthetase
MFKTRSGDSVKLVELLDEAVARAASAMAERETGMSATERDQVARALGIGAVKYADLSNDRNRDYVFDWDRMLAFEGNTGPYLQYAHARIRSIFRRGEVAEPDPTVAPTLGHPHERALALQVLAFGEAVAAAAESCAPSKLCSYLFDLATAFTTFYENCPVLKAEDEETRRSRLLLSGVSARVLASGLGLLGMEAPERM